MLYYPQQETRLGSYYDSARKLLNRQLSGSIGIDFNRALSFGLLLTLVCGGVWILSGPMDNSDIVTPTPTPTTIPITPTAGTPFATPSTEYTPTPFPTTVPAFEGIDWDVARVKFWKAIEEFAGSRAEEIQEQIDSVEP